MAAKASKILLVDDEGELIDMVSMRLEREGFSVHSATDGEQGLKKALEVFPDLILLDVNMPGMDGWEVCQKIRKNSELTTVKVVMFTATRKLKQAKELGVDQVILKPFNFDELVDIIKKQLDK